MPDGFLIDFLVLSQLFIATFPSLCQRCAAEDVSFGLAPNPSQLWTCYSRAWGLIYERKLSRVQFLTAEADNGGDWMKQFATSSLPLTFTALLGFHVWGRLDWNRFSCWFRIYTDSKINGRRKNTILPVPPQRGTWVESESLQLPNFMNVQ